MKDFVGPYRTIFMGPQFTCGNALHKLIRMYRFLFCNFHFLIS